jgi:hypothetical protein
MSCTYKRVEKKRINNSKTTLPLQYRDISKKEFRSLSFDNIHKFYYTAHAINLENHNFRKILYDAFFDALENKNGKIHRRDYLNEIEKFNNRYYQIADASDIEKIRKWKEYRESLEYHEFLKQVRQVERLEHRADLTISNALAYMYAQHQDKNVIFEAVEALEEKLKINKIPEAWSKSSLWFIANVAFFNQLSFLARVGRVPFAIDVTQFVIKDLGVDIDVILEAKRDWWDSKFYYQLTDNEKLFYRIYNDVIAVSVGESGSVMLAEAARAGTSLALHYGAKILTGIATMHPAFRAVKIGAYIIEGVKEVLDKSVLGWLGWQIGVEWSLDGWIQSTMKRVGEALYRFTEGELWENAWNFTKITRSERYELMKDFFNEYQKLYEKLVNYYRSHKAHELKEEIMKSLERFANYADALGVRERAEKLINKFFAQWRAFEARFRLHEFYQHAKREYDDLKNYTKQAYQDYKKAIKTYCYTSSEKDALKLIESQYKYYSSNIKKLYKRYQILALSNFNYKYDILKEIIETMNALKANEQKFNEHFEKVDKVIKNILYEEKDLNNKTYDIITLSPTGFEAHTFIICNLESELRRWIFDWYMIFNSYKDLAIFDLSQDCKIKQFIIFTYIIEYVLNLPVLNAGFVLRAGADFYKKMYGLMNESSSYGISADDISKITLSFITDFKNNEYFLARLKDVCYLKDNEDTISTVDFRQYNNLLKFVQRNKCFSVKNKSEFVKRKLIKDRLDNLLGKFYKAYFKTSIYFSGYALTNGIRGDLNFDVNYGHNKEIEKLAIAGTVSVKPRIHDLILQLKHIDTFRKVNINFGRAIYLYISKDKKKTSVKKRSKRSKVLCFVSSQR